MKAENAFKESEFLSQETFPEIFELNIISGGCHLYGYLLTPDKRYEKPFPTVIMSHGFPGYTTNNDLELALMRMGCVVIHMNHRGAWGSEGNYLFTNLKDDLIAVAKWAHNPAIAEQYDIDAENIFLVGHSMGGMTVLNAAKELDFIKGVAAMAAYDIGGAFRFGLEKDLFLIAVIAPEYKNGSDITLLSKGILPLVSLEKLQTGSLILIRDITRDINGGKTNAALVFSDRLEPIDITLAAYDKTALEQVLN